MNKSRGLHPVMFWGFCLITFGLFRITPLLTASSAVSSSHELYQGFIAAELIEGLKAPIWEYQFDPYTGGSLLSGLLVVPFFLVLGANLFALKLLGFFYALGSFLILLLILKKYFGDGVAWISAALIVFCPPSFSALSMMVLGSHTDSIFFGLLMIFLFFRHLDDMRNLTAFLLGMSAGVAVWFSYLNFIVLTTCFLTWLMLKRTKALRGIGLVIVGGCLGFFPWILYNLTHEFEGLKFLFGLFQIGGEGSFLGKIQAIPSEARRLFLTTLPLSLGMSHTVAFLYCALASTLIAFAYFAKANWREAPKVFFLLFPFVFFTAYLLSNSQIRTSEYYGPYSFRYFALFYFFCVPLMAISVQRYAVFRIFFLVLLIFGIMGQRSLFFQEAFAGGFHAPGFNYGRDDDFLGLTDPDRGIIPTKKREPAEFYWEDVDDMKLFLKSIQGMDSKIKRGYLFHAGSRIYEDYRYLDHNERNWRAAMEAVQALESDEKRWIYRGMGTLVFGRKAFPVMFEKNLSVLLSEVPEEFQSDIFWGVGWDIADRGIGTQKWVETLDFNYDRMGVIKKGFASHAETNI